MVLLYAYLKREFHVSFILDLPLTFPWASLPQIHQPFECSLEQSPFPLNDFILVRFALVWGTPKDVNDKFAVY
jgi:hypothetical protein